jgi:hypothetical protein
VGPFSDYVTFEFGFLQFSAKAEYTEPAVMRSDAIEIEVWPALWPLGAPHNIQVQGRQRMRDCGEARQQGLGCLA